jgi:predicted transcriptional regulator
MKALSIRQPWATLVVNGDKNIEIRSWRPRNMAFPQRIWIHAGRQIDMEMLAESAITPDLPRGAIIGEVMMTGIIRYTDREHWLKDLSRHLNRPDRYKKGLYGFILSEPKPCPVPVGLKGRLGFFDVPLDLHFSPFSGSKGSDGCRFSPVETGMDSGLTA